VRSPLAAILGYASAGPGDCTAPRIGRKTSRMEELEIATGGTDTGALRAGQAASAGGATPKAALPLLALGALGIVYGDIGTSPLYALRNCFIGDRAVPMTAANVLGVLSLVVWALIVVVSVKYLAVMLQADNQGEGGILALLGLALTRRGVAGDGQLAPRTRAIVAAIGILGAALLYGDGVITPAISVLSAMEGMEVATPALKPLVVPLTVLVLAGLFLVQRRGTERVAAVFGPIMLVWFAVIGVLGAHRIAIEVPTHPSVLGAIDPRLALSFLHAQGTTAFFVLGSVVLVVTGGEALYADLGHFGATPIRIAWYAVVFPALVLNYLGQGVLMLERGAVVAHPFFDLAPAWGLYPLIALSTCATIIASQALISGAFSLTQQAIVLGYAPRFPVVHTSDSERGQIYVPDVNYGLMVLCILTVLGFRSSDALGNAYGIAVTGTMTITSVLFYRVARHQWGWAIPLAAALTGFFLTFDLAFLSANLVKVGSGGWVPLMIAAIAAVVMTTWKRGKVELAALLSREGMPVETFFARLKSHPPSRAPGTVVYLTANTTSIPTVLARSLEINDVRHERIVLLSTGSAEQPRVPDEERVTVVDLGDGIYRLLAIFGFMERPRIERILACAASRGLVLDLEHTDFFVSYDSLLATGTVPMARWRKRLFALLARLTPPLVSSLGIPPSRVILVGREVEL
jgi:KUP system potassium uptake protein